MPVRDVLRIGQRLVPSDQIGPHRVPKLPQRAVQPRVIIRHRTAIGDEFAQQVVKLRQRLDRTPAVAHSILEDKGRHALV